MALFVAKNGQLQTLKGVFECKEMLRECVDYETYDWLKSDGQSYIKTKLFIEDYREVELYLRYKDFTFGSSQTYVLSAGNLTNNKFALTTSWDSTNKIRISNVAKSVNNLTPATGTHIITIKDDKVYGDGVSYNGYNNRWAYVGIGTLTVFASYIGGNKSNGYISDIRLTSSVGNLNLTPCQLLRSIPATLDNNGIARTAGECGMIDSISGKFFGNVASSGSFSVSND